MHASMLGMQLFLFSAVEVELTFRLDPDIINLSYTITCTVTGGTVLTSSFTGYGHPVQFYAINPSLHGS